MDILLVYEQIKNCTLASDVLQMHRDEFYMKIRQTAVDEKRVIKRRLLP